MVIVSNGFACRLRSFVVLTAVALPCAGAELEDNRSLWQQAAIADYRYAYRKHCECHRDTPPETVVTVRQGRVVDVHHRHADSEREVPAREGSLDLYWTIDGLFELIETAASSGTLQRVAYHETFGYPLRVYIDYEADFVGDELDLRLTRLEPAAP